MLITFTWTGDELPESVVLSDALDSYGVRRDDTLEVIVADGTPMVDQGGGLYTYEFAEQAGVVYDVAIEATLDDEVFRVLQTHGEDESGGPAPAVLQLKFGLVHSGEFVDADSLPTLSSPSSAYGVAQEDSNDIILADGALFAPLGTGLYGRGFVELEAGSGYVYFVEVVYAGTTYYLARATRQTKTSMLAIGRYCSTYDVEKIFGFENVHKWLAAGDIDQAPDYAIRAWEFLRDAESYIDMRLRTSRYAIPFTTTYDVIRSIAATLAGVAMYEWRGAVDVNAESGEVSHRYAGHKQWAEQKITAIKNGTLRLTDDTYQRFPEVVTE